MTAPVLKDLLGKDFTEGDRVVYASTNGIRVGKVEWIKELPRGYYQQPTDPPSYKVYINLSEHHNVTGHGKMYAKKMGYEYASQYFLKV